MDFDLNHDTKVRGTAFDWLSRQASVHGDVFPRNVLAQGFDFERRRVPVIGPQGIFKPAIMQVPLSITTSPKGPYDDAIGSDNLLWYRYRGTDPSHRDNVGLRYAMQRRLPLVYFHGVVPGRYLAMWPVYVIKDAPEALAFSIAVDDAYQLDLVPRLDQDMPEATNLRRQYATSLTRRRLHQSAFRERVLQAYRHQCAFCQLRHTEMLDAAHIIPDREPEGEPVVNNGISLCRLHHAAFDRFFVGVRPDHVIEVRPDVLEEIDGPTLQHAIQGLHGQPILLPYKSAEHPSSDLLSKRYRQFHEVAAAR